MKKLCVFALLAVAFRCGPVHAATPAATRPNSVLIFIDDMGNGDIGPFGSTRNSTPQTNRTTREGMKVTRFYAAPICPVSGAQGMAGC